MRRRCLSVRARTSPSIPANAPKPAAELAPAWGAVTHPPLVGAGAGAPRLGETLVDVLVAVVPPPETPLTIPVVIPVAVPVTEPPP